MILTIGRPDRMNIDGFASLIRLGGAVQHDGLEGRIARARLLVGLETTGGELVGCCAIKRPDKAYAARVFDGTGRAPPDYEWGWLVVRPEYRGRGLASVLRSATLRVWSGPCFCTRSDDVREPLGGFDLVRARDGLALWVRK